MAIVSNMNNTGRVRRGHPKLRLFSLSDLAHSPKR